MARDYDRPARRNSDEAGNRGSERRSFGKPSNDRGEKKIFNRRDKEDRREGGDRRSFGSDRSDDRRGGDNRGERRSFNNDRSEGREKRSFGGDRREGGERRSFGAGNREERRSFGNDRREGGERRSFGDKREGNERKPYSDRPERSGDRERGERRSFGADRREGDRREGEERRSFAPRREEGERKSYGEGRREGGERRSFGNDRPNRYENKGDGERRSFGTDRREGGERRSFGTDRRDDRREERGTRPSFGEKREFSGDKKSFSKDRNDRYSKGRDRSDETERDPQSPNYNLSRYKNNPRIKKTNIKEEDDGTIRLNRYIANSGVCSRREADTIIESGEIKVNGEVITEMGYKVKPGDTVMYGKKVLNREKMVYVLLNKPKDFITTTDDPEGRKTVMSLVEKASKERIFPVGRLDRNTTGLLLFTNDGELAHKLTHPSNDIKKIYQVELDKPITKDDFQKVVEGVELEDGKAVVDDVAELGDTGKFLGLEIHIGRNRIVRRIFEHLGYEVVTLDRVQYAGLTKKDLPRGEWRYLSEKEVIRLKFFV